MNSNDGAGELAGMEWRQDGGSEATATATATTTALVTGRRRRMSDPDGAATFQVLAAKPDDCDEGASMNDDERRLDVVGRSRRW